MYYYPLTKPSGLALFYMALAAQWRGCFLSLWLFGSLSVWGHAQLPEPQSALLRIFNDSKQADTLRLKAGIALQTIYLKNNLDSLLHLSRQMEQYGIKKRNALWQGYAWKGYGNVHMLNGQLDSAKHAFLHAKSLYTKQDNVFYPRVLSGLGNLYFYQANPDSAQYYYLKAIPGAEHYGESDLFARLHLNLGGIYQNKLEYTKALYHYELVKKEATPATKFYILTNVSAIFTALDMYKEAEKHAREALLLAQEEDQPLLLIAAYTSMILCAEADVAIVQGWVNKALSLAQSAGAPGELGYIFSNAGTRFLHYLKRPDLAEYYLKQAIAEFGKLNNVGYLIRSKLDLAFLKVQQKKYSQALQLCREVNPLISYERGLVFYTKYFQTTSDAFAGLGMVDSAYHYLNKLDFRRTKEEETRKNRSIMLSYLEYQQKQEKEALIKQKAAAEALATEVQKRQRSTIVAFGLFSLFLASIAGFFFLFFRQKSQAAAVLSQKNTALQKANERLRRFSGVVSHDILSNLDLMLTAGQVLVGKQAKKESLTQYYDIAQRTSRQLKDYCLGLLDETRRTVGTADRESNPMPIVEGVLARQEIALLQKGCKVNLEPLSPCPLPPSIVEQVFQNLISNALRYGLEAPEPRLRIAEEQDPLSRKTRWVVEDNGQGVPLALREAIFDKSANEDINSQGHNLGLNLLQETIKSYGAKIWVEERVGGGARFVVELEMTE